MMTRYLPLRTQIVFPLFSLCIAIAACAPSATAPTAISYPAEQPKRLATVFIAPTPNEAERAATQQVITLTPLPATAIPSPVPTAYIGVFIGEAASSEDGPVMSLGLTDPQPVATQGGISIGQCATQPDVVFGTLWLTDANAVPGLGCPVELASNFEGTLQIFERGAMYWRPNGEIWAMAPLNQNYWFVSSAPPVPAGEITAPSGLRPPASVFGAVWRGIDGVRDALGYARTEEQGARVTLQRFQGGALWADVSSGQTFVLYADGRLSGPY